MKHLILNMMKKLIWLIIPLMSVVVMAIYSSSCTTQRKVAEQKSGAELWGENCVRCHNIPTPVNFSDAEWETIGLHMKERANMTHEQIQKIVEFLKSSN